MNRSPVGSARTRRRARDQGVPAVPGVPGVPGGPGVILDAGLQPERTHLAWRRTVLALVLGGVVALRVLPPAIGGWGIAAAAGGTAAGIVVAALAARRAAAVASALGAGRPLPSVGALLASVAAVVAAGAAVGLVTVAAIAAAR